MASDKSTLTYEAALTLSAVEGCESDVSGDIAFRPQLLDAHRNPEYDLGTRKHRISSPASYQALPIASNARINFVYIRGREDTTYSVRLTLETAGQVVYPVRGMMKLELPSDNEATAVEVQGSLLLEYLFTGRIIPA